jgi:hypothetical protein
VTNYHVYYHEKVVTKVVNYHHNYHEMVVVMVDQEELYKDVHYHCI